MKISEILSEWFKKNARDLPWRQSKDPYQIWISEVILQQTRVNQGIGYFTRFIDRFPDVYTLVKASEQEVLKLWQGLGYYSRARHLLAAAKKIISDFEGRIPDNYQDLKKLKGVGEYTAAAVSSIAFNEQRAVVDGNVSRVISRLYGIDLPADSSQGRKMIYKYASDLLDPEKPGDANQAIMEFGALQCKPSNPGCPGCPLVNDCYAWRNRVVEKYPVRRDPVRIQNRWFHYFIILANDHTYIQQRLNKDIWKSMYEFPLIETSNEVGTDVVVDQFTDLLKLEDENARVSYISDYYPHQLTHRKIFTKFFHLQPQGNLPSIPPGIKKVKWKELNRYPIPRVIEKYLNSYRSIDLSLS